MKVKPERDALGNNPNNVPLRRRWWAYQAHRPELYKAIRGMDRVLAVACISPHATFSFLPATFVYSHQLVVFALSTNAALACLQSRPHELWARFFGSSMKDDLRYTPSDCFETFPFPRGWESNATLESIGQTYYEFRAALMIRNNEGLTKTYNRFHDPDESAPDIVKLRELHAGMDRAVLDAYGWTDIQPTCEFLLDYEEDDDEEASGTRRKKKPWRYRWPDEVRDEVLARLLELNAQRAKEEAGHAAAPHASAGSPLRGEGEQEKKKRGPSKKKPATTEPDDAQGALFGKKRE